MSIDGTGRATVDQVGRGAGGRRSIRASSMVRWISGSIRRTFLIMNSAVSIRRSRVCAVAVHPDEAALAVPRRLGRHRAQQREARPLNWREAGWRSS